MIRIHAMHDASERLSLAEQERLKEELLELNLQLSDAPAFIANWEARIGTFLEDMDRLWLARDGAGKLVGHVGLRVVQERPHLIFYGDNFTVAPHLQDKGVGSRLVLAFVPELLWEAKGRPFDMVSRTANPVMTAGLRSFLPERSLCFPWLDPEEGHDPELAEIATRCARKFWPDKPYSEETAVLEGAYGGAFLKEETSRYSDVQAHFDRHLDRERGDALVQVARFTPRAIPHLLRFLGRRVRKRLRRRRRMCAA